MQNSDNVSIPTLEELQQRFHAVPRFRDLILTLRFFLFFECFEKLK